MGAGGSKTGGSKAQNIGEIDNSSGFHLLEIHAPSMGIGIGMIILTGFLIAVIVVIVLFRTVLQLTPGYVYMSDQSNSA